MLNKSVTSSISHVLIHYVYLKNKDTTLEPNTTFLGITLDLKLNFKMHLEKIGHKLINIFKNIKYFNINSIKINLFLFKSIVIFIFDYAIIPLSNPTNKISNKLQTIQTRILKQIKFSPPRTRAIGSKLVSSQNYYFILILLE